MVPYDSINIVTKMLNLNFFMRGIYIQKPKGAISHGTLGKHLRGPLVVAFFK